MWGFEPWGLWLIAVLSLGLMYFSIRWAADPQYGARTLITVAIVAGAVGGLAGFGAEPPSCGRLDPRTGDGPDAEDVQACREAQARSEAALSPSDRAALVRRRALAGERGTATLLIVGGAGVVGVLIGLATKTARGSSR